MSAVYTDESVRMMIAAPGKFSHEKQKGKLAHNINLRYVQGKMKHNTVSEGKFENPGWYQGKELKNNLYKFKGEIRVCSLVLAIQADAGWRVLASQQRLADVPRNCCREIARSDRSCDPQSVTC